MPRLSQRALALQESAIRKLDLTVATFPDVRFHRLNIGQPDVPTPPPLLEAMPHASLVLLVGMYAQKHYLGKARKRTLTATVQAWAEYGRFFPLPHPAWRSKLWMRRNPWFADTVLPVLRERVRSATDAP